MDDKKRIYVDFDDPRGSRLVDYIAHLQKVLRGVPEEYRGEIVFSIDHDYDHGDSVTLEYYRPYTAEEIARREEQLTVIERAMAKKEKAEYERLKAKYGDKP